MDPEPTTPGRDGSTTGHFRESDIEFLRSQAKEWLEAVLGEDLDDNTSLEDLIADGSLLYRAAQHIKDDVKFPGHVEGSPSHSVSASPSMEKKNSLKYQPYASVEAFLKMCKEVGLQNLDVFNPSDAVDKKDIRRVCVCLRRLSKKGRTLGIQVPDFDNVKDTLVTPGKMPREAVRRTQETLQQSSSRSSRSSSANGLVSSETSSLIAELRKDDAESEKGETYNKVHHDLDVAAEHREPIVTNSKYAVKVAEPGVDTLPFGDHKEEDGTTKKVKPLVSIRSGVDNTHGPAPKAAELDSQVHTTQEHVDRNGEQAALESSADSEDTQEAHTATEPVVKLPSGANKDTQEAHTATEPVVKLPSEAKVEEKRQVEPFRGLVVDKPKVKPSEGAVEEKPNVKPSEGAVEEIPNVKPSEQSRKGLFTAHLQGKEPYANKQAKEIKKAIEKDDKDEAGSPWLPLIGGAVAIAGGVVGLLFLKKRSGHDDSADEGVYSGGLYKVRDGDNLTQIARKSGKQHWREIADRNPSIDNPDLIYPGDRLKL